MWIGSFIAWMIAPSGSGGAISARFSAIVLPVTVSASPCSRPASSSARRTTGTPPMRSMSVITNRPNGLTSARCGVRSPIRLKSSSVEVDLRLVRDRHQVQDGVGRAAERHDDGDRVLERLLGHDLARGDALAQQVDDGLAGGDGEGVAAAVGRRRGGAAGQRHAERLGRRWPSCWRCTCRRRSPRPGRRPSRWRSSSSRVIFPAAQAPTPSKTSMIVRSRSPSLPGQRRARSRGRRWPGRAGRRP